MRIRGGEDSVGRRHTPAATDALDVRVAAVPLVRPIQYARLSLTVACAATAPVGTVSVQFLVAADDRGVSVSARLHKKGKAVKKVKRRVRLPVSIKDLEQLKYFSGMKIAYSTKGMTLYQKKYTTYLIEKFGLLDAKPVSTPMGYIVYLPKTYTESMVDPATHSKQQTVSRSSSEVEYRALANATYEGLWLVRLLRIFGVNHEKSFTLYNDSQSALHMAANPILRERTKHVEADCHIVSNKANEGTLKLLPVTSANQTTDFLTKTLVHDHFLLAVAN
ncbi:uncharacterized protein LOC107646281 [Arachis ipaensis]|uniref:uncharacterized protein LOC107646281 n=1 Tax=Arachis ipaensis TaxID=130454 RepID=UPI0007AF008E|nr:uncharacterized protein LOC107646281 [Arachis ipaensis]